MAQVRYQIRYIKNGHTEIKTEHVRDVVQLESCIDECVMCEHQIVDIMIDHVTFKYDHGL